MLWGFRWLLGRQLCLSIMARRRLGPCTLTRASCSRLSRTRSCRWCVANSVVHWLRLSSLRSFFQVLHHHCMVHQHQVTDASVCRRHCFRVAVDFCHVVILLSAILRSSWACYASALVSWPLDMDWLTGPGTPGTPATPYQILTPAYYDQSGQLMVGNGRGMATPVRLISPAPMLVNTQQSQQSECSLYWLTLLLSFVVVPRGYARVCLALLKHLSRRYCKHCFGLQVTRLALATCISRLIQVYILPVWAMHRNRLPILMDRQHLPLLWLLVCIVFIDIGCLPSSCSYVIFYRNYVIFPSSNYILTYVCEGLTSQRRDSFGSVDMKRPMQPYYTSLGSPSPVGSLGFMPPGASLTPPAPQLNNPGNGLAFPGKLFVLFACFVY